MTDAAALLTIGLTVGLFLFAGFIGLGKWWGDIAQEQADRSDP